MAPDRFGRYEVLAEVGQGSMARVYGAWDPAFERVVAVKTVKSEYLTGDSAAEYLGRFSREARAAGGLSHPGIVPVFDVGPNFIVMEFVEGRTLRELLRERHRFPPEEAIRLLAPIAEAVDYAHRAGIVHRDIKPANIMVQPDGTPKLMDFGIAHVELSVITVAGEILGSPSYMAPEQVAGEEVTPSTDVYALAIVAYELLTGHPPFQGPITQVIYKVINESPLPPRRWNAALPPWYDDIFARALGKLPAGRYATAVELVAALDLRHFEHAPASLASGLPAPGAVPPRGSSPARLAHPPKLRTRAVGLAAVFGALLVASSSMVARGTSGALVLSSPVPRIAGVAALAPAVGGRPSWHAGVSALAQRASGPAAGITAALALTDDASGGAARPALRRATPAVPDSARPRAVGAKSPSVARARARSSSPAQSPPTRVAVRVQLVSPPPAAQGTVGEVDFVPPRRIAGRYVSPRQGLSGVVAISFVIDETGLPTNLAVVESAGPILDAAAIESVRSWRFEPARKGGVKVSARLTSRHTYLLAR